MRHPEAIRERGEPEGAAPPPGRSRPARRVMLVGTEWGPVVEGTGGLEHVVIGWAHVLSEHHQVVVASVGNEGEPAQGKEPEPFDRVFIRHPRSLREQVLALGIDVVQLNNRPGWVGLLAGSAPVVLTLHNSASAWTCRAGPETDDALADGLRRATAVTAVSRSLAGQVTSGWPERPGGVHVTYPFADPVFFPARTAVKNRVVLFPNRLLRKKGVTTVVEAAAALGDQDLDFVFLDNLSPWSAPTDEHAAMRRAVAGAPNCRLVAPLPDRRGLAGLMASSAAVLLPAVEPEGFGLVSVEAQAAGTHAVVSDLGGLPETLASRRWAIPPGDADALGHRILEALADPIPPASISEWVSSRFSARRSASALEDVLDLAVRVGA